MLSLLLLIRSFVIPNNVDSLIFSSCFLTLFGGGIVLIICSILRLPPFHRYSFNLDESKTNKLSRKDFAMLAVQHLKVTTEEKYVHFDSGDIQDMELASVLPNVSVNS
jgi:hypothetical protein